jgi:integration host factor subunit beta
MTRSDLIEQLAERKGLSINTAEAILHEVFGGMSETLVAGNRIEIRGFGSFELREYEGYTGRNPKTGLEVVVKPKKTPFFKAGKDLKERILESGIKLFDS